MSELGALMRSVGRAVQRTSPRSMDLKGRTAIVTGGGDGIGAAVVRELHARGARVAAIDRDGDAASQVTSTLPGCVAFTADVRDRDAMRDVVKQARQALGPIDVVVANAGVAPVAATVRTMDPADFDRVLSINVTGTLNTVQPCLEDVIARGGHVVVVASVAAFVPGPGSAPYMASKAAVEQLGRSLRVELAPHGATATTAYFGIVETEMTRLTLDEDPLGPQLNDRLPGPLRARITPADAGRVIVDGIARRSARVIAPAAWNAWMVGRGAANVVVDRILVNDPDIGRLVHELEARE